MKHFSHTFLMSSVSRWVEKGYVSLEKNQPFITGVETDSLKWLTHQHAGSSRNLIQGSRTVETDAKWGERFQDLSCLLLPMRPKWRIQVLPTRSPLTPNNHLIKTSAVQRTTLSDCVISKHHNCPTRKRERADRMNQLPSHKYGN